MKKLLLFVGLLAITSVAFGQEKLMIGGSVVSTANFFIADSTIGAINTPQYDHQLFGAETWVALTAAYQGFEGGIRFDMFNNSNLIDPKGSYSDQKIGRWFLRKQIKKLNVSAGYIYDQVGSGIIYRAYEERSLAIDNALYGLRLAYDLSPNWKVTAFTGKQKKRFETYPTSIKGGTLSGYLKLDSLGKFAISPGIGIVSTTLSDETMSRVVAAISTYTPQDSIGAKYNTCAMTLYNTLSAGRFSWYVEGAYKSNSVLFDPLAEKHNWTGEKSLGRLINEPGSVIYSALTYAQRGLGITLEGKRTENFNLRVDPFVSLNRGALNFLPPMARSNTYALTAFYAPATQEFGEQGVQIDVKYSPSRKMTFGLNYSNIQDLDNQPLYQEVYADFSIKHKRKWVLTTGVQLQNYNVERYYNEPGAETVKTVTPFVEYLYKFTRKKSLRMEAQFLNMLKGAHQDLPSSGSWAYLLAEYNIAPHWSFSLSDMFNAVPGEISIVNASTGKKDIIHYPRADIFYTTGSTRFGLSYVKQVDGIVCTGGVCRLEPAFSGVKATLSASF